MNKQRILIVSGTHGNEINPIYAAQKFNNLKMLNSVNKTVKYILGNPEAVSNGQRYIDIDLNRSFRFDESQSSKNHYEVKRAFQLFEEYGPKGLNPFQVAIDLHTTTSCMGTSVVVYGRRQKDLCLAAILQDKFGLPVYLHEKDSNQTGFLVEAWPCGLVIEIGPVAQNHYDPIIVKRFLIILDYLESLVDEIKSSKVKLPREIKIFTHKYSIDYPKDENNIINGLIHPLRLNQDWNPVKHGDPLFLNIHGETLVYLGEEELYPVFIGEAAYREKNIAMSFTRKEIIKCSNEWIMNLLDF